MEIIQISEYEERNSVGGKLLDILWLEENSPDPNNEKLVKQWKNDLWEKYKAFNTLTNTEVFHEAKYTVFAKLEEFLKEKENERLHI